MAHEYEINELAKEESWRLFRIIGELVEGFDKLADVMPAVSIYGSARERILALASRFGIVQRVHFRGGL